MYRREPNIILIVLICLVIFVILGAILGFAIANWKIILEIVIGLIAIIGIIYWFLTR